MLKRRRFTPNLLSIAIIDLQLHYGVYARNWWETVNIKSTTNNNKCFIVPYCLFMRVGCELNGQEFIITVTSNDKNSLKLGFQCTVYVEKLKVKLNYIHQGINSNQSVLSSSFWYKNRIIFRFSSNGI